MSGRLGAHDHDIQVVNSAEDAWLLAQPEIR
jgi:hypothetical protein